MIILKKISHLPLIIHNKYLISIHLKISQNQNQDKNKNKKSIKISKNYKNSKNYNPKWKLKKLLLTKVPSFNLLTC
jgi:hypothetical protein